MGLCTLYKETYVFVIFKELIYVGLNLELLRSHRKLILLSHALVFIRGTWKGLKVKIPEGGHTPPNSTAGDNLL